MEQKLEQIISFAPLQSQKYATIDRYIEATTALYTPPPMPTYGYGMHSGPMYNPLDMDRCVQRTLNDYGFERRPLWEPPKIEIEPYKRGMELDGGLNLYGNKNTAIFHQDLSDGNSFDIHHHKFGGGRIEFNPTPRNDPFKINLPWERQTKLNDY